MDHASAPRQMSMAGRDLLSAIVIIEDTLPPPMSLGSVLAESACVADLFLAGDAKTRVSPSRIDKARSRVAQHHRKAFAVALGSTAVGILVLEPTALHVVRPAKDAIADARIANGISFLTDERVPTMRPHSAVGLGVAVANVCMWSSSVVGFLLESLETLSEAWATRSDY